MSGTFAARPAPPNTFLTIEEMQQPEHRAILEQASKKCGFASYDIFMYWILSPSVLPYWTIVEREFIKPLIEYKKASAALAPAPAPAPAEASSSETDSSGTETEMDIDTPTSPSAPAPAPAAAPAASPTPGSTPAPAPAPAPPTETLSPDMLAALAALPTPTYALLPLFEGLFGTKHNLTRSPARRGWKPNHFIAWFILSVWWENCCHMAASPWAGCGLESTKRWMMQLCWVLDGMIRCKYAEEIGVTEVKGQNGYEDKGCLLVYKL